MKSIIVGLLAFVLVLSVDLFAAGNVPIYTDQGGATMHVASGGTLHVESGASFTVGDLALSNLAGGSERLTKTAVVALASGSASIVGSWLNPVSGSIFINRMIVDITTGAVSASLSCGVGGSAASISHNLLDRVTAATASVFNNVTDIGASGLPQVKATSGQYVTCAGYAGNTTSLIGNAYIYYHAI